MLKIVIWGCLVGGHKFVNGFYDVSLCKAICNHKADDLPPQMTHLSTSIPKLIQTFFGLVLMIRIIFFSTKETQDLQYSLVYVAHNCFIFLICTYPNVLKYWDT